MRIGSKSVKLMLLLVFTAGVAFTAQEETILPSAKDKQPVLLVHGLGYDADCWGDLPQILENRGFDVYILDYNDWDWLPNAFHKNLMIEDLIVPLAREIEQIVIETDRSKINVIAHSFGGIIVRAYVANFGEVVERAAGYNDDIARIIYVATPHFGMDASENQIANLVKATDYGPFKNSGRVIKALQLGSDFLYDLNDYYLEHGDSISVKQITVSSEGDDLVPAFSANLDGLQVNIDSEDTEGALFQSNHVYLKNYLHTDPDLLGEQGSSIIDIDSTEHPLIDIATSFFQDKGKWRWMGIIPLGEKSYVAIRIERAKGLNPNRLRKKSVKLKLYQTEENKKKVKLKFNEDSKIYYARDIQSGTYELTVPVRKKKQRFNMSVDSPKNAGNLLTFDVDDPPDDPFDDGGDDGDGGDGGDGGSGDLPDGITRPKQEPADVYNLSTLQEFALYHFGSELFVYQSPSMNILAKKIRDKVVERYPRYFLPWEDSEFGHFDVFADQYAITTIDFVIASTAPGVMWNKLAWIVNDNPLWAR